MSASGFLKRLWLSIKEIGPLIPAALYLLVFLLVVTLYLFGLSFSMEIHGKVLFPVFKPLTSIIAKPEFLDALLNTTMFVLIGTPLELIAGFFLAYILYREFAGRSFVRSLLLIPLAIPALVTATLLFILFDFPGGHMNHLLLGKYAIFPAIISEPLNWRGSKVLALGISLLGKVWRDMPISMLILLAGLNAIDPELFDAAKTMGAGLRKRLFHIILPLMIPSISAVILLRSIEMWKEFIFPFVIAGKYELLGTLIESLYNNWGDSHQAAVVAVVLVGCIIISTFAFLSIMEYLRKTVLKT
jgi:ABC-type sugar transport system permease subunit